MAPHETPASEKWTEIEHLPEWDEEYYHVYTAKKYGKWLMLKTLKPDLRDKEEYKTMIEKEFDVRYNLAHPHIVMINDYEDVPGLGRCIITDDIYGDSLRKIINEGKVTADIVHKVTHDLVDAMDYIQTNHIVHHPIRPERIIFTEKIGNLKLIDVGFDQKNSLSPADTADDIFNFGMVLTEMLKAVPTNELREYANLRRIAARCVSPNRKERYRDIESLKMAIDGRNQVAVIVAAVAFVALLIGVIAWLSWKGHA